MPTCGLFRAARCESERCEEILVSEIRPTETRSCQFSLVVPPTLGPRYAAGVYTLAPFEATVWRNARISLGLDRREMQYFAKTLTLRYLSDIVDNGEKVRLDTLSIKVRTAALARHIMNPPPSAQANWMRPGSTGALRIQVRVARAETRRIKSWRIKC